MPIGDGPGYDGPGIGYARRLDAYHEAGHASIFWFFQQKARLTEVRLESVGGVANGLPLVHPGEIASHRANPRGKATAMMLVMHAYSGPCAEHLADPELAGGDTSAWYVSLCDEFELAGMHFENRFSEFDGDDMPSAVGAVQQLRPDWNGSELRDLLDECAAWTYEALTTDRMPKVVDAIASKLLKGENPIAGVAAWETMKEAWGETIPPPITQPKWQARFKGLAI